MEKVRNHNTHDNIKASFISSRNDFDFQKQKSGFNFPTIVLHSRNKRMRIGVAGRTNEFKRTVADFLYLKVSETSKKDSSIFFTF